MSTLMACCWKRAASWLDSSESRLMLSLGTESTTFEYLRYISLARLLTCWRAQNSIVRSHKRCKKQKN